MAGIGSVFQDIIDERARQDKEWGGPQHDSSHRPGDWCGYIHKQNQRAANAANVSELEEWHKRMVKIAALAVAAIEANNMRGLSSRSAPANTSPVLDNKPTVSTAAKSALGLLTTGVTESNEVIHPQHYNRHPSGIECWAIARHYGFLIGNTLKYIWRAGLKGHEGVMEDEAIADLEKALNYLREEIEWRKERRNAPIIRQD